MRYDYGIQKAIRNLSRGHNMLTMPSMATGSMQSARAKARVAKAKCRDCLWNWENVHTGEGRVCYNNTSERYHKKAGGKACTCFETRVPETFGDIALQPPFLGVLNRIITTLNKEKGRV